MKSLLAHLKVRMLILEILTVLQTPIHFPPIFLLLNPFLDPLHQRTVRLDPHFSFVKLNRGQILPLFTRFHLFLLQEILLKG